MSSKCYRLAIVAKAIQTALRKDNVSVNWISNADDSFGSLLFLTDQWGAAFSSMPSVSPEGMSLKVNDIAVKRGNMGELFAVTSSLPDEALRTIFEGRKASV